VAAITVDLPFLAFLDVGVHMVIGGGRTVRALFIRRTVSVRVSLLVEVFCPVFDPLACGGR
jgi:hypothetical protein